MFLWQSVSSSHCCCCYQSLSHSPPQQNFRQLFFSFQKMWGYPTWLIWWFINFNLVMSPWQRATFTFISLFTSNSNFCTDSRVRGQVTDHGLIMSRLTGWIVLKKKKKKQFCTFGSIAILILFSERLIFSGRPTEDLQSFCVGPGFDSMSPSISSCFNLRKLRLYPL